MWKPQRVRIIINENSIEQVTAFKRPGFLTSEYKSDLEDKLPTYKKLNGIIRRHFGKQMTEETQLTIRSIAEKEAFEFGNEAWVVKKGDEKRMEATEMKFLRHLLGITELDR